MTLGLPHPAFPPHPAPVGAAAAAPRIGAYRLIAADNPWRFKNYSKKGEGRNPIRHYPCMTVEALKALPVADLAHPEGCALLFWVTDPFLECGIEVLNAWGFSYKTVAFVWAKTTRLSPARIARIVARLPIDGLPALGELFHIGPGYWTHANPEICLLATAPAKGVGRRVEATGVRQLILEERREHSRKPEAFYERAERLVAAGPGERLDLFGRTRRPGWDAWGNETDKFAAAHEAPA